MRILERDAVISGIAISDVGRRTGTAALELTMASCLSAIADAGLQPQDIDGIASFGDTPVRAAAKALDIEPGWWGGGFDTAGLLSPLASALWAVARGDARHVVVYRTVTMLGGSIVDVAQAGAGDDRDDVDVEMVQQAMEWMGPLLTMHAYAAPNWVAMHCMRHMHVYGTTKEQLGWLAITTRDHASRNDKATYRDPITLDDYFAARPISDPFGLFDCDVPIDGSIAIVVSHADYAPDAPNTAVRVEAIGGSSGEGGWDQRPGYPEMASMDAAAELWSRTDLRPSDVSVAELYDGFTFLTLAWLEALGFCGPGESGPFVEGGDRIRLGGELPLNTYGGQLSAGRMHGYWLVHEAVLQLRHQAGSRQVEDADVAVAAAGGGPIAGALLLTR